MTEIKLLALDLDGTLFNTKKEVSLENKEALKAVREKGIKVVITTGLLKLSNIYLRSLICYQKIIT